MAFVQRWLVVLSLLLLSGGPLWAATREERVYAAAVRAFQDKFYPVAQQRFTQYLQTYRKSTNAPAAVLLLAESDYYLRDYAAAAAQLSDPTNVARAHVAGLADRYQYWQAEAQDARGDSLGSAQSFAALAESYPDSPLALGAVVEAAAVFGENTNWAQVDRLLENPSGVFQRLAQLDPTNSLTIDGRLLQAQSKQEQQDSPAALRLLAQLATDGLTPTQAWQRTHILFRASLAAREPAVALQASTNLLTLAAAGQGVVWAAHLAESRACHARALEAQGDLEAAIAAWHAAYLANQVSADRQQQAILELARLAMKQKKTGDAEAWLDAFLLSSPEREVADVVRLTLGELHLQDYLAHAARASATNDLSAAQLALAQCATNGPLAGDVFLNRGWCDWLAAQLSAGAGDVTNAGQAMADSLTNFEMSAARLTQPEPLAVARYKMGDARFALAEARAAGGDAAAARDIYAAAQVDYTAVLAGFPGVSAVTNTLGASALYQVLRTQLALGDTNGVDDSMSRLLAAMFTGEPAADSLLLAGEGFSDLGFTAKARRLFQQFATLRPDSPLLPRMAFAAARTYERDRNWLGAETNYQAWLDRYPTNDLHTQVEYARDWAVAQNGDQNQAFELFSNFISRNPTNALTPLVLWWVADHDFQLGGTNLLEAERRYQLIFQDFPAGDLSCRARLMAGRTALARSGYTDASRYFVDLLNTNCPEDLKDQARFAYCETLRLMAVSETNNASLELATNILLSQICPKAATNLAGALAWAETGDCDAAMGALDAATNAYLQAQSSPVASQQLIWRCKVGLGLMLEKKAEGLPDADRKVLLNQAFNAYFDVLDPESNADSGAKTDDFWVKKAGWQALPLVANNGLGTADEVTNLFNRLEILLPQLKDSLAKKRAALQKN